ncbi:MAG: methylcobamide--CoM methyltransferase [Candidatus Omnitrophica bacterium]|nr:methylcobamide--CoM methyltransferase [Candidatus Omnitrophota bacterium]
MLTVSTVSHYPKIGDSLEEQLLRRTYAQFDRKEVDLAHVERTKDEVTRQVIQEQIDAGVELITDGQIRWNDAITYIAGKMKGFELTGLLRYFDTNTFYRQPICKAELTSPESLLVKDFQFANAISSVPVKAVLTGPFTIARLSQDKHYKDFEVFALKLAAILGEEVKRLAQVGATVFHFDDPALLWFKKEKAVFKKIWTKLASYFPENIETILFLNFGDLKGIYPEIQDLPFTTLGLDLATETENWEVLESTPCTKKLLAGIVDARNTKMETEEELQGKLEKLLAIVSPENLSVSPSHGLEFLPRASAKKKLANLAKVVREFREAKVKT